MTIAIVSRPLQAAIKYLDTQPGDESTALIAAKCRALIVGYHRRFANAGYTPVQVEQMVQAPLMNPETQRTSRTFTLAGVLDVVAEKDGRRVLIDHKTTSMDIADPDAPYWRQLVVEGQVNHYMLLEWLNGEKVDDAVWDVMRKPGIAPKKLSKRDQQLAITSGEYFGQPCDATVVAQMQATGRETYKMYEARLIRDCTTERPQYYFQRRMVPRLDAELLEYAGELWDHGQEIVHTRSTNRHVRNSGACMLYGSPCKFLGICSGHDSPDSDKWARKASVHNELPDLGGDGRDVLTNSRIRCFQTCRRKHYYEYELGIERVDTEEREALLFGSLWHETLRAWWEAL